MFSWPAAGVRVGHFFVPGWHPLLQKPSRFVFFIVPCRVLCVKWLLLVASVLLGLFFRRASTFAYSHTPPVWGIMCIVGPGYFTMPKGPDYDYHVFHPAPLGVYGTTGEGRYVTPITSSLTGG